MKHCDACNVDFTGDMARCPLCQNELRGEAFPRRIPRAADLSASEAFGGGNHHVCNRRDFCCCMASSAICFRGRYRLPVHRRPR